ncbi:uncharacterized protein LOC116618347 isoform X2 [Nematostella vectensis]|uniref:uncharacterized protein LOC116618347 isoform X2 n=1 Tax=Nematostella vectensis TaxID=45351 RepID=UPI002077647B|nr:uncharacterized protein LOC116618347 isoform X2 [Nematostella vectensis]
MLRRLSPTILALVALWTAAVFLQSALLVQAKPYPKQSSRQTTRLDPGEVDLTEVIDFDNVETKYRLKRMPAETEDPLDDQKGSKVFTDTSDKRNGIETPIQALQSPNTPAIADQTLRSEVNTPSTGSTSKSVVNTPNGETSAATQTSNAETVQPKTVDVTGVKRGEVTTGTEGSGGSSTPTKGEAVAKVFGGNASKGNSSSAAKPDASPSSVTISGNTINGKPMLGQGGPIKDQLGNSGAEVMTSHKFYQDEDYSQRSKTEEEESREPEVGHFQVDDKSADLEINANSAGVKVKAKPASLQVVSRPGAHPPVPVVPIAPLYRRHHRHHHHWMDAYRRGMAYHHRHHHRDPYHAYYRAWIPPPAPMYGRYPDFPRYDDDYDAPFYRRSGFEPYPYPFHHHRHHHHHQRYPEDLEERSQMEYPYDYPRFRFREPYRRHFIPSFQEMMARYMIPRMQPYMRENIITPEPPPINLFGNPPPGVMNNENPGSLGMSGMARTPALGGMGGGPSMAAFDGMGGMNGMSGIGGASPFAGVEGQGFGEMGPMNELQQMALNPIGENPAESAITRTLGIRNVNSAEPRTHVKKTSISKRKHAKKHKVKHEKSDDKKSHVNVKKGENVLNKTRDSSKNRTRRASEKGSKKLKSRKHGVPTLHAEKDKVENGSRKNSIVIHRPPIIYHPPPEVYHRPDIVVHRAPIMLHRPAIIYHQPPVVVHRPAIIYHQPPIVFHQPPPVVNQPILHSHDTYVTRPRVYQSTSHIGHASTFIGIPEHVYGDYHGFHGYHGYHGFHGGFGAYRKEQVPHARTNQTADDTSADKKSQESRPKRDLYTGYLDYLHYQGSLWHPKVKRDTDDQFDFVTSNEGAKQDLKYEDKESHDVEKRDADLSPDRRKRDIDDGFDYIADAASAKEGLTYLERKSHKVERRDTHTESRNVEKRDAQRDFDKYLHHVWNPIPTLDNDLDIHKRYDDDDDDDDQSDQSYTKSSKKKKKDVVVNRPPIIYHPPPEIYHRPDIVVHRPPLVIHRPPIIYHQPPVIVHRPAVVYHQPPIVFHQPPPAVSQPLLFSHDSFTVHPSFYATHHGSVVRDYGHYIGIPNVVSNFGAPLFHPGGVHYKRSGIPTSKSHHEKKQSKKSKLRKTKSKTEKGEKKNSVVIRRPPIIYHPPPEIYHRPDIVVHRAPIMIHRAPIIYHQPPVVVHRPAIVYHQPSIVFHQPPPVVRQPFLQSHDTWVTHPVAVPVSTHIAHHSTYIGVPHAYSVHGYAGLGHEHPYYKSKVPTKDSDVHAAPRDNITHKKHHLKHKKSKAKKGDKKNNVIIKRPPIIYHPPPEIFHRPDIVVHRAPLMVHRAPIIYHQPPVIVHRPAIVYHQPELVFHQPFPMVHQPVMHAHDTWVQHPVMKLYGSTLHNLGTVLHTPHVYYHGHHDHLLAYGKSDLPHKKTEEVTPEARGSIKHAEEEASGEETPDDETSGDEVDVGSGEESASGYLELEVVKDTVGSKLRKSEDKTESGAKKDTISSDAQAQHTEKGSKKNSVVIHRPPIIYHPPPEIYHRPDIIVHRAPIVLYRAPIIYHQPPVVVHRPAIVYHQPSIVFHQPPPVVNQPIMHSHDTYVTHQTVVPFSTHISHAGAYNGVPHEMTYMEGIGRGVFTKSGVPAKSGERRDSIGNTAKSIGAKERIARSFEDTWQPYIEEVTKGVGNVKESIGAGERIVRALHESLPTDESYGVQDIKEAIGAGARIIRALHEPHPIDHPESAAPATKLDTKMIDKHDKKKRSPETKKKDVVVNRPPIIYHPPPEVYHRPEIVVHRAPILIHRPPIVYHQPPVVVHRPAVVYHQPPIVFHQPPPAVNQPMLYSHDSFVMHPAAVAQHVNSVVHEGGRYIGIPHGGVSNYPEMFGMNTAEHHFLPSFSPRYPVPGYSGQGIGGFGGLFHKRGEVTKPEEEPEEKDEAKEKYESEEKDEGSTDEKDLESSGDDTEVSGAQEDNPKTLQKEKHAKGERKNLVMVQRPDMVYHPPPEIYDRPDVIVHRPDLVYHQPSIVYHQASVVIHRPPIVYHQPPVVFHQPPPMNKQPIMNSIDAYVPHAFFEPHSSEVHHVATYNGAPHFYPASSGNAYGWGMQQAADIAAAPHQGPIAHPQVPGFAPAFGRSSVEKNASKKSKKSKKRSEAKHYHKDKSGSKRNFGHFTLMNPMMPHYHAHKKQFVVIHRPPVVYQPPPEVVPRPDIVVHQPDVVLHRPPLAYQQPPTVVHHPTIVYNQPPVVFHNPPPVVSAPVMMSHDINAVVPHFAEIAQPVGSVLEPQGSIVGVPLSQGYMQSPLAPPMPGYAKSKVSKNNPEAGNKDNKSRSRRNVEENEEKQGFRKQDIVVSRPPLVYTPSPDVFANPPVIVPQPAVIVQRPPVVYHQAPLVVHKPPIVYHRPPVVMPAPIYHMPVYHHGYAFGKAKIAKTKLKKVKREAKDKNKKHDKGDRKNVIVVNRPPMIYHPPPEIYDRPDVVVHQPDYVIHRPSVVYHQPSVVVHRPPIVYHQPPVVFHQPPPMVRQPVMHSHDTYVAHAYHEPYASTISHAATYVGAPHYYPGGFGYGPWGPAFGKSKVPAKKSDSKGKEKAKVKRSVNEGNNSTAKKSDKGDKKNTVIVQRPPMIYHPPPEIYDRPDVVVHRPDLVVHRPSIVYHQPSVVVHRPPIIYHQPPVMFHQPPPLVHQPVLHSHETYVSHPFYEPYASHVSHAATYVGAPHFFNGGWGYGYGQGVAAPGFGPAFGKSKVEKKSDAKSKSSEKPKTKRSADKEAKKQKKSHKKSEKGKKKNIVVMRRPPVVYHPPPEVYHRPDVILHRPDIVIHRPSVVFHQPSVVVHRPAVVYHQPPLVFHQPPPMVHQPIMHSHETYLAHSYFEPHTSHVSHAGTYVGAPHFYHGGWGYGYGYHPGHSFGHSFGKSKVEGSSGKVFKKESKKIPEDDDDDNDDNDDDEDEDDDDVAEDKSKDTTSKTSAKPKRSLPDKEMPPLKKAFRRFQKFLVKRSDKPEKKSKAAHPETRKVNKKNTVVINRPPMIYHPPPEIYDRPNVIVHRPDLVYHQPSIVYHQPSVVVHRPPIIYHSPPVVFHQPSPMVNQRVYHSHDSYVAHPYFEPQWSSLHHAMTYNGAPHFFNGGWGYGWGLGHGMMNGPFSGPVNTLNNPMHYAEPVPPADSYPNALGAGFIPGPVFPPGAGYGPEFPSGPGPFNYGPMVGPFNGYGPRFGPFNGFGPAGPGPLHGYGPDTGPYAPGPMFNGPAPYRPYAPENYPRAPMMQTTNPIFSKSKVPVGKKKPVEKEAPSVKRSRRAVEDKEDEKAKLAEHKEHHKGLKKNVVVMNRPPIIYHPPPEVYHRPDVVLHRPDIVIHRPSVVLHQAPVVVHRPAVVYHQPPVVVHQPPPLVHQPIIHSHDTYVSHPFFEPFSSHITHAGTYVGAPHFFGGGWGYGYGHAVGGFGKSKVEKTDNKKKDKKSKKSSKSKKTKIYHAQKIKEEKASKKNDIVVNRPPIIYHPPPEVYHRPDIVVHRAPIVLHRPPIIYHQPPVIVHRPAVVYHQPPIVFHQPPPAVHQPVLHSHDTFVVHPSAAYEPRGSTVSHESNYIGIPSHVEQYDDLHDFGGDSFGAYHGSYHGGGYHRYHYGRHGHGFGRGALMLHRSDIAHKGKGTEDVEKEDTKEKEDDKADDESNDKGNRRRKRQILGSHTLYEELTPFNDIHPRVPIVENLQKKSTIPGVPSSFQRDISKREVDERSPRGKRQVFMPGLNPYGTMGAALNTEAQPGVTPESAQASGMDLNQAPAIGTFPGVNPAAMGPLATQVPLAHFGAHPAPQFGPYNAYHQPLISPYQYYPFMEPHRPRVNINVQSARSKVPRSPLKRRQKRQVPGGQLYNPYALAMMNDFSGMGMYNPYMAMSPDLSQRDDIANDEMDRQSELYKRYLNALYTYYTGSPLFQSKRPRVKVNVQAAKSSIPKSDKKGKSRKKRQLLNYIPMSPLITGRYNIPLAHKTSEGSGSVGEIKRIRRAVNKSRKSKNQVQNTKRDEFQKQFEANNDISAGPMTMNPDEPGSFQMDGNRGFAGGNTGFEDMQEVGPGGLNSMSMEQRVQDQAQMYGNEARPEQNPMQDAVQRQNLISNNNGQDQIITGASEMPATAAAQRMVLNEGQEPIGPYSMASAPARSYPMQPASIGPAQIEPGPMIPFAGAPVPIGPFGGYPIGPVPNTFPGGFAVPPHLPVQNVFSPNGVPLAGIEPQHSVNVNINTAKKQTVATPETKNSDKNSKRQKISILNRIPTMQVLPQKILQNGMIVPQLASYQSDKQNSPHGMNGMLLSELQMQRNKIPSRKTKAKDKEAKKRQFYQAPLSGLPVNTLPVQALVMPHLGYHPRPRVSVNVQVSRKSNTDDNEKARSKRQIYGINELPKGIKLPEGSGHDNTTQKSSNVTEDKSAKTKRQLYNVQPSLPLAPASMVPLAGYPVHKPHHVSINVEVSKKSESGKDNIVKKSESEGTKEERASKKSEQAKETKIDADKPRKRQFVIPFNSQDGNSNEPVHVYGNPRSQGETANIQEAPQQVVMNSQPVQQELQAQQIQSPYALNPFLPVNHVVGLGDTLHQPNHVSVNIQVAKSNIVTQPENSKERSKRQMFGTVPLLSPLAPNSMEVKLEAAKGRSSVPKREDSEKPKRSVEEQKPKAVKRQLYNFVGGQPAQVLQPQQQYVQQPLEGSQGYQVIPQPQEPQGLPQAQLPMIPRQPAVMMQPVLPLAYQQAQVQSPYALYPGWQPQKHVNINVQTAKSTVPHSSTRNADRPSDQQKVRSTVPKASSPAVRPKRQLVNILKNILQRRRGPTRLLDNLLKKPNKPENPFEFSSDGKQPVEVVTDPPAGVQGNQGRPQEIPFDAYLNQQQKDNPQIYQFNDAAPAQNNQQEMLFDQGPPAPQQQIVQQNVMPLARGPQNFPQNVEQPPPQPQMNAAMSPDRRWPIVAPMQPPFFGPQLPPPDMFPPQMMPPMVPMMLPPMLPLPPPGLPMQPEAPVQPPPLPPPGGPFPPVAADQGDDEDRPSVSINVETSKSNIPK